LSRFTLRSFGVYYFSLVVGVLAVAWRRTPGPVVGHVEGGLGITVPLLAATLLNLRVFDLSGHPGQWIYLCSYAVALVISVPIVILYRRAERRGAPSAHPGDRKIPAPRGAASAESVGKPAARLRRR
jgi:hypothetical protein